ncbi:MULTISPECIES: acyl-ACP--UDP-N-acetylglucosamine O-acyltransferase [unclassified Imperialibacter]|uniref:acyl-ACP--UDP-N-acetylglucosamine O-acyltransferase n=1 Tax=unclassified Imperialibacter TaxID=2629706 RepID=UPI00125ADA56|nr:MULTISPECIES: acyl-ACP--UDP-N-acetylglucosamine O-acyltransferase [unclassified Imperialibacter]CAD5251809.1 UDP-N-acetylglucosamine acetyltransferase [Imperialibacter sp. 89]CAD5265367.1 UDP-N-acetylglucosamine acetyltransferase [Imperialibacter sp. 75]VVT03090.1 UDP-N-acetylglucosamine acetyltransferase [Imperialibacter sp. EC-SDR9]
MIHPLAYVHPEAKVGPNVTIEPFAVIHHNVEIGEGTWIGSHAVIYEGARIGKNVKIFNGASISTVPQDLKFKGESTETFIGDGTSIREFVTISRGTSDKLKTVVGSDCLIMAYAHVAHDCTIGNNCILGNSVQIAGHVVIDDWAIISGTTAVHQFSRIGSHVMVSGGSLVRKDIPPFTTAGREPLSFCGINSVGLRRRGFSNEKINEIQDIYRYIYFRGLNHSKAIELILAETPHSNERDQIVDFIKSSERGIMKGFAV